MTTSDQTPPVTLESRPPPFPLETAALQREHLRRQADEGSQHDASPCWCCCRTCRPGLDPSPAKWQTSPNAVDAP